MMDSRFDRMADVQGRPRGRPRKTEPAPPPPAEAPPVHVADHVHPLACPRCGAHIVPKVTHRRPNGDRDCMCPHCGGGFVYAPATVRLKV